MASGTGHYRLDTPAFSRSQGATMLAVDTASTTGVTVYQADAEAGQTITPTATISPATVRPGGGWRSNGAEP